jgi:hypothetical protein
MVRYYLFLMVGKILFFRLDCDVPPNPVRRTHEKDIELFSLRRAKPAGSAALTLTPTLTLNWPHPQPLSIRRREQIVLRMLHTDGYKIHRYEAGMD